MTQRPGWVLATLLLCACWCVASIGGERSDSAEYQPIVRHEVEVVDLNRATRAQIERLPQVGVAKAELILTARDASPFVSWEDFMQRVPGFRRKTLERMQAFGATIIPVP
jgi:hypothetical protein